MLKLIYYTVATVFLLAVAWLLLVFGVIVASLAGWL